MNDWDTELYTYFESRRNIFKLMKYRGYEFADHERDYDDFETFTSSQCEKTPEEIKCFMSENLTITHHDNSSDNCYVVWTHEVKLNSDKINEIIDAVSEMNTKNIIIISDTNPTPTALDASKLLKSLHNIKIDIWLFEQTQLFVPEHKLVPSHRICTPHEKNKLANIYGLDIPKILSTDIMVKYLGAVKGNVIEIIRPSETWCGKTDFTYRIVV